MPFKQEFRECLGVDVVGPFELVAVGLGGVLCRCKVEDFELVGVEEDGVIICTI